MDRYLWWEGMETSAILLKSLRKIKGVKEAEVVGSVRRGLETIGNLDLLVVTSDPPLLIKKFTSPPFAEEILAKEDMYARIRLRGGIRVDLRIIPQKEFAFALWYFTGSKEHNKHCQALAVEKGLFLSAHGFEALKNKGKVPAPKTEKGIYQALGLAYIPPELRENKGEIEAARKGSLPSLVEEKDIRGTFHNHTTASDGKNSLREMVKAAHNLGWEYIGIADHSKSSVHANGQSEEALYAQIEEIQKINRSKKFYPYVFAGVECDILADGKMDYSNEVLKDLDYVVASIHTDFEQDEKTLTKRLLKAIENPYTTMIGHVTGRLLLRRFGYSLNLPKIIDACIANQKIIEINSAPKRMEMDWRLWHKAKEKGLLTCINTDAHKVEGLLYVKGGVNVARKGWLEKKDVLNTFSLAQIKRFFNWQKSNARARVK